MFVRERVSRTNLTSNRSDLYSANITNDILKGTRTLRNAQNFLIISKQNVDR